MRFLMMVGLPEHEVAAYESGEFGEPEMFEEMERYNQSIRDAGIWIDGQGLHGTTRGAKIHFGNGAPLVTDGPWTESKELLGGYWVIDVPDKAAAIAWASKAPMQPGDTIILRQIAAEDDYTENQREGMEAAH